MSKPFIRLLLSVSIGFGLSLLTLLLLSARPATAQVPCEAPDVGDWVINVDCILQVNQAAAENVSVEDGAQLLIPDGVTLGVGFHSYSLRVENGSRLIVQNGGRIATFRCPGIDPDLLNAPYRFEYGLTANQLLDNYYNENDGLFSQGYRPHRLTGYRRGDDVRFATDWIQIGGPQRPSAFDLLDIDFEQRFNTLSATHRLIDVSAYNFPSGEARFADIWVENSEGLGWWVHPADTLTQTQQRIAEYPPLGRVPVRIEAYQDGGLTRYMSLWVEGDCQWIMEPRLTLNEYVTSSATYSATYRQEHIEQYTENGEDYYAAVWYQRHASDPIEPVWVNSDWYLFQRNLNNNWCNGFRLTNFYAADHPVGVDGVRYGGIWTFDEPLNITQTSPLSLKVQQEVNCAIGRSGAAVVRVNANTGVVEDEIYHHADQIYGVSSVSKIAILYSLLRLVDANTGVITLGTTIPITGLYGANVNPASPCVPGPFMTCVPQNATNCATGPTGLMANTNYGIGCLAQLMIRVSHNWATNRLIDYVIGHQPGVITVPITSAHQINQDMQNLGLSNTRVRRYVTGSGPVPNAQTSYQNGEDVTSTPRELVTLLMQIAENDGLLSDSSYSFFWNTLNLGAGGTSSSGKGFFDDAFGVALNSTPTITMENKTGSNAWGSWGIPPTPVGTFAHVPQISAHLQGSEAGRLNLDNDGDGNTDTYVYYAVSINEADGPPPTPSQGTMYCIGAQVVRAYTGQSSVTFLTTLTPPCQSP